MRRPQGTNSKRSNDLPRYQGMQAHCLMPNSRSTIVTLATFLVTLSIMACQAVILICGDRASRDAARAPASAVAGENATRWQEGFDTLQDKLQHSVISIEPINGTESPLPPGVDRWPGPGEVILSPGLIKAGASEGILTRYGRTIGSIGQAGLAFPNERLAYVRPQMGVPTTNAESVGSYGVENTVNGKARGRSPSFWDSIRLDGVREFLLLLFFALVFPSVALVALARRLTLRVNSFPLLRDDAKKAIVWSAVVGWVLSMAVAFCATLRDWTVPYLQFTVPIVALDRHILGLGSILGWALVLGFLLAPPVGKVRLTQTLFAGRFQPWNTKLVAVSPLAALLAVQLPGLVDSTGGDLWIKIYLVFAILCIVTSPLTAVAFSLSLEGAHRVEGSQSLGRGQVVRNAWVRRNLSLGGRNSMVLAFAILLLVQASSWFGQPGSQAVASEQIQEGLGDRFAVVYIPDATSLEQLVDQYEAAHVSLMVQTNDGQVRIQGSCQTLRALSVECVDHISSTNSPLLLSIVGMTFGGDSARVEIGNGLRFPLERAGVVALLLASKDGGPIDLSRVKEAAYRSVAGPVEVELIADSWRVGAMARQLEARWLVVFGIGGLALIIAVSMAGVSIRLASETRSLIECAEYCGGPSVIWSAYLRVLVVPSALSAVLGSVLAYFVTYPLAPNAKSLSALELIGVCFSLTIFVSVTIWVAMSIRTAGQMADERRSASSVSNSIGMANQTTEPDPPAGSGQGDAKL